MDSEVIFLVEESLEGGCEAIALGHSIYTEADTLAELKDVAEHLNKSKEDLIRELW